WDRRWPAWPPRRPERWPRVWRWHWLAPQRWPEQRRCWPAWPRPSWEPGWTAWPPRRRRPPAARSRWRADRVAWKREGRTGRNAYMSPQEARFREPSHDTGRGWQSEPQPKMRFLDVATEPRFAQDD